MVFLIENIHKSAIDYTREENHPGIINLLSKGPIIINKAVSEEMNADKKH